MQQPHIDALSNSSTTVGWYTCTLHWVGSFSLWIMHFKFYYNRVGGRNYGIVSSKSSGRRENTSSVQSNVDQFALRVVAVTYVGAPSICLSVFPFIKEGKT